MTSLDIVYFSVILFAALVTLTHWKRRRDFTASRLNRGLHSYISGKRDLSGSPSENGALQEEDDNLVPAQ
jgi:hypothetical protein